MPDLYVDVSVGDDDPSNDGQVPARPLRTITGATLRAATAGGSGTIHVAAGIYRATPEERFPLHVPPAYALRGAGEDATFIVFTGESITPTGGTIPYWGGTAIHAGAEVSDLTVEATPAPPMFGCSGTFGIYVQEDGTRINNVRVRATAGVAPPDGFMLGVTSGEWGVEVSAPLRGLTIENCRIERCRSAGVLALTDRVVIRDCHIASFEGGGIYDTSWAVHIGWGLISGTTVTDVSNAVDIRHDGEVIRCTVSALNPSPLRGTTMGIGSLGYCRIEHCDLSVGPGYAVGIPHGRLANCRIAAQPGEAITDVEAGDGLVTACEMHNCRVAAAIVERCILLRTASGNLSSAYIKVHANEDFAATVGDNHLDGAFIEVAAIDSDVYIGGNRIEKALWGIRILDGSNRVTVAGNTMEEIRNVGLLIAASGETFVRDNVIKRPSYLFAKLVEIRDGSTPLLEGNSFGARTADGRYVVNPAIVIRSRADFGGGVSHGGNHFGPLELSRLIIADIPGGDTVTMRDNFWPGGSAVVDAAPGTFVDTAGARVDPLTEL